MGREIVYCNLCGIRILEDDLLKGRALTLLDKVFCAACKAKAFSQMRAGEAEAENTLSPPPPDLMEDDHEPTEVVPRRAGARLAAPPTMRPMTRKQSSMMPIIVGGIVGFAATILLVVVIIVRKNEGKTKPIDDPGGTTPITGTDATPESAAARAMNELNKFARRDPTQVDAILAKCNELEGAIRGSAYVEEFNRIRRAAENVREKNQKGKSLDDLVERAKAAAKSDTDYTRYGEIIRMFESARETATKEMPEKVFDIREAQREYSEPYESAAKNAADDITTYAAQLASEKRFANAVAVIDSRFPAKYRESKAWKQLKAQRDQYEAQSKVSGTGSTDPTDWKGYFRRAGNSLGSKDWRKAREDYKKGLTLLPPFSTLTDQEKKGVAWGEFNLACTYFIEAKLSSGDGRKQLNDSGFEYLDKAITDGVMGMPCDCHKSFKTHIEKDEDLDQVRDDKRYKEIHDKAK